MADVAQLVRADQFCSGSAGTTTYITVKNSTLLKNLADVAQLVRAPGCGSGGRGFNSHHSPHEVEQVHFMAQPEESLNTSAP